MGLGDILAVPARTQHKFVRGLQLLMVGIGAYGLVGFRFGALVPATIGLIVTFLPAALRREYDYNMNVGLVLWITVAVFLHAIGSVGLYVRYSWYDEITHTVSATLIAAIGYATFRALELHTDEIDVPDAFRGVFIVVFVLAAAVAWEILEFAFGGYFTVYGIDDIVTDMLANLAGALIVVLGSSGPVQGLVGFFRDRLRSDDSF